jgi:hypothetical protein
MLMNPFDPGKTKASGATPRRELQSPLAQEENFMKIPSSIPHPDVTHSKKLMLATPANHKAALVHIGLYALARGRWRMVAAISEIIRAKELRHE